MFGWLKRRKRRRIAEQPWPAQWSQVLTLNVRQYRVADEQLRLRWQDVTRIIVAEKYWEGCDGLAINDEIRVTIAAQAAMMVLGVQDFYFDNVRTILIHPAFQRATMRDGMVVEEGRPLAGQAWQGGPVVLSWADVLAGARSNNGGRNLVVHEFAHCLDGLDGEMGGNPVFDNPETAQRWQQVCSREFEQLGRAAIAGRRVLLDHYGASSPAEFFAVASETFFEMPERMQQSMPELFELMVEYFKVNPDVKGWGLRKR